MVLQMHMRSIRSGRLRVISCFCLLIFLCAVPLLDAQQTKRVEPDLDDWITGKEPRFTPEETRALGTSLVVAGTILNVVPLVIGLPLTTSMFSTDIDVNVARAFGIQIGIGAAAGLLGGLFGLAGELSWFSFGIGAIIGSVIGLGASIAFYAVATPAPQGGTAVAVYTAILNVSFAGLITWISGIAIGESENAAPGGPVSIGLRLNKDEHVTVAFTGSQLLVSY